MLSRTNQTRILSPSLSCLQISCAIFTTGLGLIHLVWGIWILASILIKENGSVAPVHQWLFLLIQGITWVLIGLFVSVLANRLTASSPRMWTTCAFLFSALLFGSSVYTFFIQRKISNELVLDVLCFPGAILVLFCAIKGSKFDETVEGKHLYEPLTDGAIYLEERNSDISATVTPFAKAGFFSQMSFWWLNSLMGKGRHKPLEDSDIPQLRPTDRAEYCYRLFSEELNKQKEAKKTESPSILWTIISCYHKDILISGFFALLKILTISAGPMLLRAFIKVAEGHGSFQYEGCLLAALMFISKALESISQRQWYFRSRIIGLRVKSLLSAAIYRKQLRLSNIAKMVHSSGEIMNYVTVDAYRIGEFPYWFHYTWTTSLQLCIALLILYNAVGLATVASLLVIIVTVAGNAPLAKLQHKFQTKLMEAQDERLKAMTESLVNMKILKLYAWENHFKIAIEELRKVELKWLSAFQLRKAYNSFLFWSSPVLVSAVTFVSCYFLQVPLYPSNVFTFIATLRLVQEPIRIIPDVIGVVIQGKVALERIVKFLEAPELQDGNVQKVFDGVPRRYISINQANFSWQGSLSKLTLRNLNLDIKPGEKVAICGEVGAGKSSLLAAVLGEIPKINGSVHVSGTIAYVSQTAWIQMGTIRDNVLFGSVLDKQRYRETIEKCSLVKDLEMLPHGDLTEIGERGVNLSGGQKQRIQLARALYQNADIYLLDDPFSAVDAHTSTSLFNDYVMKGLSGKTVLLVSHQVDFFPAFDSILVMADGEIIHAASYLELLATSKEFQNLVDAYKDTRTNSPVSLPEDSDLSLKKIETTYIEKKWNVSSASSNQLIKQEEKETGDMGLKPYLQYLNQNKGFLYFFLAGIFHLTFVSGQILQNSWMAANVQNPRVSTLHLIIVYSAIGISSTFFLLLRSIFVVVLGIQSSRSLFSHMLNSIFQAPMSFFDSTPLGRILSRVSSDLSIVDIDIPFTLVFALCATINSYSNLGVLGVVTWQVLFVSIPMIYLSIRLQRYYLSSAKELMRINGTTKSVVANHLAESIVGATIIRAFKDEDRFFSKNLDIINKNASPFFHSFTANEWLIGRLELMSAGVLSSSALVMSLLPSGTYGSGFIGLALSYGLSLNVSLVFSIQNQCTLANYIISVERLNQYMHIPSEGEKVTASNRPSPHWPDVGKVEFRDLKVRYHPGTPLVLRGISCIFEGGKKIGIVGRTGSGKSTLIGALFRLVAPAGGEIVVDGIDISKIDLHDLRSRFGIIPQDPTLFRGTVRLNLDPMHQYSDQEIWQVLEKCQLHEAVQEKGKGLDSLVVEEGLNWSMGQRQLFCLGRALLRRSRILVLDEATALIDNATDAILQKTIRKEFVECTVITVAHRIPTVMDCDMVLTLSDGKLVEYDQPMKLISSQSSMFGELVKEYWAHTKTFAGPY